MRAPRRGGSGGRKVTDCVIKEGDVIKRIRLIPYHTYRDDRWYIERLEFLTRDGTLCYFGSNTPFSNRGAIRNITSEGRHLYFLIGATQNRPWHHGSILCRLKFYWKDDQEQGLKTLSCKGICTSRDNSESWY